MKLKKWLHPCFLALVCITSACADRREKIAMALLYPDKGSLNKQSQSAFNGAILGRFPPGSRLSNLVGFAESLGGFCGPLSSHNVGEHYDIGCGIPEADTFGWTSSVEIDIQTDNSTIVNLRVRRVAFGL